MAQQQLISIPQLSKTTESTIINKPKSIKNIIIAPNESSKMSIPDNLFKGLSNSTLVTHLENKQSQASQLALNAQAINNKICQIYKVFSEPTATTSTMPPTVNDESTTGQQNLQSHTNNFTQSPPSLQQHKFQPSSLSKSKSSFHSFHKHTPKEKSQDILISSNGQHDQIKQNAQQELLLNNKYKFYPKQLLTSDITQSQNKMQALKKPFPANIQQRNTPLLLHLPQISQIQYQIISYYKLYPDRFIQDLRQEQEAQAELLAKQNMQNMQQTVQPSSSQSQSQQTQQNQTEPKNITQSSNATVMMKYMMEANLLHIEQIQISHLLHQVPVNNNLPKNSLEQKNVQGDIVVEGLKLLFQMNPDESFLMYINIAICSMLQLQGLIIPYKEFLDNITRLAEVFQSEKNVQEATRLQNGQTQLPEEIEHSIAIQYYMETKMSQDYSEQFMKQQMNTYMDNFHDLALARCKLLQKLYLKETDRASNDLNYSQFPFRSKCQLAPLFLQPGRVQCIINNASLQYIFATNLKYRQGKKGTSEIRQQFLNILRGVPIAQKPKVIVKPEIISSKENQYTLK